MRAVLNRDQLEFVPDYPTPGLAAGEALVRPLITGICNTDIEITKGYFGFKGVTGHEVVGIVEECPDDPGWVGKRVVTEINASCEKCPTCLKGRSTHCPNRSTLGIFNRDGAMADLYTIPIHCLLEVPENVSDEEAVFVEPLAAACEILEQVKIKCTDRVVLFGDGKLGLLIAQVLQLTACDLLVVGRNANKLSILEKRGIHCTTDVSQVVPGADIVVEATGSAQGFASARSVVRPKGTMVMKSTFHGDVELDLSMLVVDEITMVGSRCGPFAPALRLLEQRLIDVKSMIHGRYSLDDAIDAFAHAEKKGVLKILLDVSEA